MIVIERKILVPAKTYEVLTHDYCLFLYLKHAR